MAEQALLFTDVVDSTSVSERLGDTRAAQVWTAHDLRARDLLARYRGREIDRADGFFLLFEHARDAADFALAYHDAIADLSLTARAGMHVGDVALRENDARDVARGAKPLEVDGIAKPIAARVMALAAGGQTLVTAAALDAIGAALPDDAEAVLHGHYRLKGIEDPIEIFEVGKRGAAPFAPPQDAVKAYRVVRKEGLWMPVREVRHNLAAERDAFIGRTRELRDLAARLDAGTRLITVLGPAGTGKTRLVRRYGLAWLGDWPGGVYFCDLSEARSLDGIHFAVAAALGVPLGRDDPVAQLGNAIAGRGRCLLILDNFEQVAQLAQPTVGRWLDRAADAAFLVTSRERLHLAGEELFPVDPLPVAREAIELFATRAVAHRPGFTVSEANQTAIAEVVRLLDGMPLAIELAAARIRVLTPAQLVERMRDRFALLADARSPAARQATLRAAIDWSWELLTPWEKDGLAQCSIFDGGFTLEAAEAVIDLARWPDAPPAVDVVQALLDKSLLRTWTPSGHARYDVEEMYFAMYLSIREYAAAKLDAQGERSRRATEVRHGAYFAQFGSDEETERLFVHGGTARRRALALEIDNLIAACRRAVARGDAHLAAGAMRAACDILELTGPYTLGVALGDSVLTLRDLDADARARVLAAYGLALRRAGRGEDASRAFEESLALYRALGNRHREAFVLLTLGNALRDRGRVEEARSLQEAALAITREVGYRRLEGHALGNLGIIHAEQGRLDQAKAYFEQALAIHREVGNRYIEGIELSNLGNACRERGDFESAHAHYVAALATDREVGNRRDEGIVIANLGLLCQDLGRRDEACERMLAALAVAREVGDRRFEGYMLGMLALVLREREQFAEAIAHCEQALAIHRAVGNRHQEGVVLGTLAELLAMRESFDAARAALGAAEATLREIGAAPALAMLRCQRAFVESAAGDPVAANAALDAAIEAAREFGADSEVGRRVAALRDQLRPLTGSAAP